MALLALICLIYSPLRAEDFGMKKKRPKLHDYGNVVIDNFSEQKGIAPVVFPHWLHRAKYTCRLCHVDLRFAMEAGATKITETDIKKGRFCGFCHNGKESFARVETDSKGAVTRNCARCHSYGNKSELKNSFYEFRKRMPKDRFGNGIDWIKAEEQGLIIIKDYFSETLNARPKMVGPKDFDITSEQPNVPDTTLSHQKHAVWNGCSLCHPEIFGVKKNEQSYSMQEIFDGKFCGVCHGKVAFPNIDCQKCHVREVLLPPTEALLPVGNP